MRCLERDWMAELANTGAEIDEDGTLSVTEKDIPAFAAGLVDLERRLCRCLDNNHRFPLAWFQEALMVSHITFTSLRHLHLDFGTITPHSRFRAGTLAPDVVAQLSAALPLTRLTSLTLKFYSSDFLLTLGRLPRLDTVTVVSIEYEIDASILPLMDCRVF